MRGTKLKSSSGMGGSGGGEDPARKKENTESDANVLIWAFDEESV